ncbi:uncharacterized protein LOC118442433 [Vespa mandarinia]|uniref:uncharacterized protein LOC118442433 n=1 Tax=Vespa mandarinia TaxID=7446 RepID=UPI001617A8B5|nr:uncharacterized protein LOC118442433 [Vespa mandarinia]
MDQNRFIWDEVSEGLILPRVQKIDDEQIKRRTIQFEVIDPSEIYCPHNYLILNFHETLNPSQKIKFRKYYLRKVAPNEPDVIILQDIKDLVMFLLISPVSVKFINFFHLPVVDNFLRALIIYFQYYIEIWEKLMEERVATLKKAPNPLAGGHRIKYADELHILRCMLSKEYADLIVGCQDTIHYHHIISGKKRSSMTQSQGEKDLRIFEVLIHISHRVVWIALHRKHFHLIESELHRLLRTEVYNKKSGYTIKDMLESDIFVLHGPQIQSKRKLLKYSPLIEELIYSKCNFQVLSLGMIDVDTCDPRIAYLHNALLIEEEMLPKLGIKIGILGQERSNYDLMLMLLDSENSNHVENTSKTEKSYDKKNNITNNLTQNNPDCNQNIMRMPSFELQPALTEVFEVKKNDKSTRKYSKFREDARKKWIIRQIESHSKQLDTYSIMTII